MIIKQHSLGGKVHLIYGCVSKFVKIVKIAAYELIVTGNKNIELDSYGISIYRFSQASFYSRIKEAGHGAFRIHSTILGIQ